MIDIAYKILLVKSEGKWKLGKPRRTLEDNMEMDLEDEGLEAVDWIYVVQNRENWWALVNTIMNL